MKESKCKVCNKSLLPHENSFLFFKWKTSNTVCEKCVPRTNTYRCFFEEKVIIVEGFYKGQRGKIAGKHPKFGYGPEIPGYKERCSYLIKMEIGEEVFINWKNFILENER